MSYLFWVLTGYGAALYWSSRYLSKGSFREFLILAWLGLLIGFLSAKLGFAFQYPSTAFLSGGFVFYFGFLGASTAFIAWAFLFKKPLLQWADFLVFPLLIAHAFGRVGCFFRGCCFGLKLPEVYHASLGSFMLTRVPVQLFESVGLLFIFIFLRKNNSFLKGNAAFLKSNTQPNNDHQDNNYSPGMTAFTYLIAYATLRFFLEFFRADPLRGYQRFFGLELSTSQWTALVLMIVACSLVIIQRTLRPGLPKTSDKTTD